MVLLTTKQKLLGSKLFFKILSISTQLQQGKIPVPQMQHRENPSVLKAPWEKSQYSMFRQKSLRMNKLCIFPFKHLLTGAPQ